MNTTTVLHLTTRDNGRSEVRVYHVPDDKIDRATRRDLNNCNGQEITGFILRGNFKAYEVIHEEQHSPIVGNISHVYWFTDTLPSSD